MDSLQNAVDIFAHAVAAVNPSTLLHHHLHWHFPYLTISGSRIDLTKSKRVFVIGAGKAAALMAQTVEEIFGDTITGGVVVTKYDHGLPLKKIRLYEAGHPIPDGNSVKATEEILKLAGQLTPDDIVLFLMSGGASSLLADYPKGSNLEEIQEVFGLLLKSGATIHEVNTVRKHLSNVKGGQLARHIYPARLYSLILSDVIGDDLDVIGSGPTVPDSTTFKDAKAILRKYDMINKTPPVLLRRISDGCQGKITDTPKEGDLRFVTTNNKIIGSNRIALEAAAIKAKELGYQPQVITDRLQGEASVLGTTIASDAVHYKGTRPACLLYGGESTVTIKGDGLGGRNMELTLAAGIAINDVPGITILAAGTDGTDGPTDAAGAFVDADMMKKAMASRLDPLRYLKNNDSYHFFLPLHALVKTGPTQTNVMDLVIVLIHE
jgi:glycerate 2-kinase